VHYVDEKCERLALPVQIPNVGHSLQLLIWFEVLLEHFPGRTEKTMENLSKDQWSSADIQIQNKCANLSAVMSSMVYLFSSFLISGKGLWQWCYNINDQPQKIFLDGLV
jgi:hypothetical protein